MMRGVRYRYVPGLVRKKGKGPKIYRRRLAISNKTGKIREVKLIRKA